MDFQPTPTVRGMVGMDFQSTPTVRKEADPATGRPPPFLRPLG